MSTAQLLEQAQADTDRRDAERLDLLIAIRFAYERDTSMALIRR